MIFKKNLIMFLLPVGLLLGLIACNSQSGLDSSSSPTETQVNLEASQTPGVETPTLVPTIFTIATNTANPMGATEIPVTPTAGTKGGPKTDFYKYVGQNYPDNMKVSPGAVLTITWAIKNVGTIGWTKDYTLRYFSGIKAQRDYYPFPQTVGANGVVNLSVTIAAPKAIGTYTTWWKLTNPQGQNFGDVDFNFEVSNSK